METAFLIGVLLLAAIIAARLGWIWFKWRGDRLVSCPENQQPVGVAIDLKCAAKTGFAHEPTLRLSNCTRWPERQGCGQECLRQIEASPEECLIRNILSRWYANKSCVICGKPIGEVHWDDHRPALLNPEQKSVEWAQVPAETLPAVLKSHAPVCWNCHIVQTFCREHPDLVVDRARAANR